MPDSEHAHYDNFVSRTLREVRVGLKLDNYGDGSLKRRVHDALERRTENATGRCAAQKVIDGRFILGGDDASYLASGLAVLWSTVGHGAASGEAELSLAPAALYSPDAVNGIRRGLLAALDKRNKEMRDEAPNLIGGLMRALLTLLPFVYKREPEQPDSDEQTKEMRRFLMEGEVKTVEQRNTLFAFLVRARGAIDSAGDGQIPSSRLASQIVDACLSVHKAVYEVELDGYKKQLADCYALLSAKIANADALSEDRAARIRNDRKAFQDELQQKNDDLEALRGEMRALKDQMNRSAAGKDHNISELGIKLADCESNSNALQEELELRRLLHEMEESQWDEEQRAYTDNVASLKAQCAQTKQLLDTANQTTSTQQEQMANTKGYLVVLNREVEVKGNAMVAHIAALQAKVQSAEDEAKAKESILQEGLKVREGLAADLERVIKERDECTKELLTANLGLERSERGWEALKSEQAALLVKKRELEEELGATNASNTSTRNELKRLLAQCNEDLRACRKDNTDLKSKHAATETELKERIEACAAELAGKKVEFFELKSRLSAHTKSANESSTKWKQAEQRMLASIENLRRELAALKKEKDKADAEVRRCQEKCDEDRVALRKEVDDGSVNLERAQQELQHREKNLEDFKAQTGEAVGALKKANTVLAQAQNSLAECAAREAGYAKGLTTTNNALADASTATERARQAAEEARVCRSNLEIAKNLLKIKEDAMNWRDKQDKDAIEDIRRRLATEDIRRRLEDQLGEHEEKKKHAEETLKQLRSEEASAILDHDDIAELDKAIELYVKVVGTADEIIDILAGQLASLETDGLLYEPFVVPLAASASRDAWVDVAIMRGLVGQRGPTEPAAVGTCAADELLPYALPDIDDAVKHLLPVHMLLQSTADPTNDEVIAATAACAACEHAARGDGAKRQRLSQHAADLASPSVASEALALFGDDFAIIGKTPAASLPAERCGVETPHEVRWMPQGPRGRAMARVAVLEHAIARCTQIAAQPDVRPSVADALRQAATALKLQQLQPLYELQEAADFDDEPHPLGTGATRLVTRPCAIVRGTLSLPVGAGVAPLAGRRDGASFTQDAALSQAMGKTTAATAATAKLRNSLRRQGLPSNVYVAPRPSELAFQSAPTGASEPNSGGGAPPAPAQTSERIGGAMYRDETFLRIINRLIVAAAALDVSGGGGDNAAPDPVAAFLNASKSERDGGGAVNPKVRREGLWAEMHRNVAISQDRLWVFVRLMSGKIGGNVSEVITMADEATLKAAKAIQEQRLEVSKRVSDMQSKIVETVVSSMLKNSKMTIDYKDDQLAVIDAEAEKSLKDLSTGASGRPFFEANVALKNLKERNETPPKLQDVLSGLANVGEQMQATLERTLAEPSAASASLVELSHPSNSYFVAIRGDALAAVRGAQERLNCELGVQGSRRRLTTWELVEGGCAVLTDRFAELCSYMLVQARTSTGVSAMYVSHLSISTNVSQARVALARLLAAAHAYIARVAPPAYDDDDPKAARFRALTQGEQVRDIDVTSRIVTQQRMPLHAPISQSGFSVIGARVR